MLTTRQFYAISPYKTMMKIIRRNVFSHARVMVIGVSSELKYTLYFLTLKLHAL